MRRTLAAVATSAALALTLGACGSDGDTPGAAPTAAAPSAAAPSTSPSASASSVAPDDDDDRDDRDDRELTGSTLTRATDAALAATGEGRVTETGGSDDADHAYEVDVLLPSGEDVTVELDADFTVTEIDR